MLPEALGTEFFSLKAGEARPSLVLSATVDAEGNVSSEEVRFACVRLAENVCYEAAEARIEAGESLFAAGWRLAQALKNRRLALGAVIIERPEPEIELRQEDGETRVELVLKDEAPKAKLLVSELMILANEAVARFAAAHDLPLLYRTQDVVLPSTFCGVWTEPHEIYRVVKQFGPTLTEVEPRPHRGLGLAAYSSITSPLRRYLDFLNCAQVFSFLTSGQPRAGREELAALLPRLAARNEAAGQIQRFRPRYWKLLYLKQNMARDFPAVVVEDCGNLVSFSLPEVQIFVRAPKDMVGDKVAPGMRFCLRFGRIDPLTNELRVAAVLDEEAARAG
jgi:exoribonuclease-2